MYSLYVCYVYVMGYGVDGSIDGENKYELTEIVRYLEKVIQMCETS